MTRSWAREFAPDILVNAIAPGPTDTAMLGPESTSPETLAKEAQIPLGRIGRPEEIASRRRLPRRAGRHLHDRPVRQPERRCRDVLTASTAAA